jgi:radical SAM superfamily enzyme YgiQ (UPF0313 family)
MAAGAGASAAGESCSAMDSVLLVNPPTRHIVRSEVPRAVREEGSCIPPLGILYLQSYALRSGRHEVAIWDAALDDPEDNELVEELRRRAPALVGVTCTTHALVDALRVARAAKEARPETIVVFGGAHASVFPRETAALEPVDWVVQGEGERAFLKLLDRLESGGDPAEIPGVLRGGANGAQPLPAPPVRDLDELPFPDRRRIPYRRYRNVMAAGAVVATMITSRGCPFQCAFCSTPHEACRMRSPENVVDEIEEILALGIDEIDFMDDTFNLDPRRAIAICEEIVRRGLRFRWNVRARVRGTSWELLQAMKRAGCARIQYGVETGTDEGMRRLNKGLTIAEALEVFRLTRRAGIRSVAYFMIGCPHERTIEDIRRTMRFAAQLDPDYAMFNVFTPYPGTALYQEALQRGLVASDEWLAFARDPRPGFRPSAWGEFFTEEELYEILDEAYRRFYWRPRVIWRNLREIGGWRGFTHKARAALKMLPGAG